MSQGRNDQTEQRTARGRVRRRRAVIALTVAASTLAGVPAAATPDLGGSGAPAVVVQQAAPGARAVLSAEIRRTEAGIPHVKADDWSGLGYGYGYAFAEDNACLLAEMVVTANAQRSLHFGDTPSNLSQDLFHQQLIDLGVIEDTLATPATAAVPGPSQRVRDLVAGTAAGFNRHLRDVGGAAGISDPGCSGKSWVRPITELDLWRTFLDSAVRAGRGALSGGVVSAQPPGAAKAAAVPPAELPASLPEAAVIDAGSNAYGLGSEATVAGSGMLLGNPHFPWQGRDRFYEMHLTIPGEYDMIGAALSGQPIVEIGHNESMGWSHTVSTARRFTLYELKLAPGKPTTYVVDGQERAMTSQTVRVRVRGADGGMRTETRTLWSSEYGPIVTVAPLGWSDTTAYALRDVNEDAGRTFDGYIEMGQAASVRELADVLDEWQHLPWINTIAADATGEAFYGDHSVVPNVSDEKLDRCITPIGEIALDQLGVFILDGSDSGCGWGTDPDSRVPGILGPSKLPTLFRDDYVTNSNDSYWLTNPEEPLEGFDRIIGVERSPRSLRTRLGLLQVQERLAGTDGLDGEGFTLEQLQEVMFSNRVLGGELVRDDLVALCERRPTVTVDGTSVDLRAACAALAGWDLRVDLDSRGSHVFREFVDWGGLWWDVPFDVGDPVGTPNTLDTDNPEVLEALGRAVQTLTEAGIPFDARLGDIQSEPRPGGPIPIHGGTGQTGTFNVISAPLDGDGYRDVVAGASFVLAAEFTPDGPRSRALLAYSNSTDPTSPHVGDQTERYSRKEWVDLDFHEADILADPDYRTMTIVEGPPPAPFDTAAFCDGAPPAEPFADVEASNPHRANIACLAGLDLLRGRADGAYVPQLPTRRDQMASLLTRMMDAKADLSGGSGEIAPLPAYDGDNRFGDVPDTSVHVAAINRLAAAGIALGTEAGTFDPAAPVSRAQMASFIARAEAFMTGDGFAVPEPDHFVDVAGVHRANVNAVAGAGIAVGDGVAHFRPRAAVRRDQVASFLARTLAVNHDLGHIAPAG